MRVIQKEISLEPMTSRLPGVLPAYKDGKLMLFDESSLGKRGYEYPSNYGMIPVLLAINPSTHTLDCNGFKLSWETISKWYAFFVEYYNLLKDYGHCGRVYVSAVDYYENESREKYADQMKYGSDKKTYQEIDRIFAERGGRIGAPTRCSNIITDVTDIGFFDWMKKNLIPTFEIPTTYRDAWKKKFLYYPDVIKWIGWFSNRTSYTQPCSATSDCCDCDKYFSLGGSNMLGLLRNWYNGIQNNINALNSFVNSNLSCTIPTIDEKINLQVSIDDIGEFSIFSNEYKLGANYAGLIVTTGKTSDNDIESVINYNSNKLGRTVVIKDGRTLILKSGKTGYKYNVTTKEKEFKPDDWEDYTEVYVSENKNQFTTNFNYYGFDQYGNKVTGSTTDVVINSIRKKYEIVWDSGIYMDGNIYEIEEDEYLTVNNKTYYVKREKDTQTPYTFINGKKSYAIFDNRNFNYYFSEYTSKRFPRVRNGNTKKYITCRYGSYEVNGGSVNVLGNIYYKIDGYFYSDASIMYVIGSSVYEPDSLSIAPTSGYTVSGNYAIDNTDNPVVFETGLITGTTTSKLYKLRSSNVTTDDIGNELEGIFNIDGTKVNQQPQQGEELNLLYEKGNVANIMAFSKTSGTTDPEEAAKLTENYYIGDIITNMWFYYVDVYGNPVGTKKAWATSSLSTIKSITKPESSILLNDNIFCDIEYCIGATLKRESGGEFQLATTLKNGVKANYGVKYTETVQFVKSNVEYYLKQSNSKATPVENKTVKTHSVSYPVVCYLLKQDDDGTTPFEMQSLTFYGSSASPSIPENGDMEKFNGTTVYPVFRQEYMFGNSSMEKVDTDIYIDRGINAALDKHLKLGEVTNMEALLEYNNGFFKIMNN